MSIPQSFIQASHDPGTKTPEQPATPVYEQEENSSAIYEEIRDGEHSSPIPSGPPPPPPRMDSTEEDLPPPQTAPPPLPQRQLPAPPRQQQQQQQPPPPVHDRAAGPPPIPARAGVPPPIPARTANTPNPTPPATPRRNIS